MGEEVRYGEWVGALRGGWGGLVMVIGGGKAGGGGGVLFWGFFADEMCGG